MKKNQTVRVLWMAGALGLMAGAGHAAIVIGPSSTPKEAAPVFTASSQEKAFADELKMGNGDTMHGSLQSVKGGENGRLAWKHEQGVAPLEFLLDGMDSVTLGERKADGMRTHKGGATLTNGDVLAGDLESLDDKSLVLDTWYAGKLTIPRQMVSKVEPGSNTGAALYSGPGGLEGWVSPYGNAKQQWEFKAGALVMLRGGSGGSIGREIAEMPDSARMEFDLAWDRVCSLSFTFFTGKVSGNSYESEGYTLAFQYGMGSVSLMRRTRSEGMRQLGSGETALSSGRHSSSGKAHVTVLADRKSRKIILLVDGKQVKEWTDSADFKGDGKCIMFNDVQGQPRIANIRIAKWNGRSKPVGEGTAKSTQDTLVFNNGDSLSGRIVSVTGGKVRLETAYAEPMEIPLERIVEIVISPEKAGKARRNPGDVRLQLAAGGVVTANLAELRDGVLKGSSGNFGEFSSPLAAFAKMEFKIPDDKAEEKAGEKEKNATDNQPQMIEE